MTADAVLGRYAILRSTKSVSHFTWSTCRVLILSDSVMPRISRWLGQLTDLSLLIRVVVADKHEWKQQQLTSPVTVIVDWASDRTPRASSNLPVDTDCSY